MHSHVCSSSDVWYTTGYEILSICCSCFPVIAEYIFLFLPCCVATLVKRLTDVWEGCLVKCVHTAFGLVSPSLTDGMLQYCIRAWHSTVGHKSSGPCCSEYLLHSFYCLLCVLNTLGMVRIRIFVEDAPLLEHSACEFVDPWH